MLDFVNKTSIKYTSSDNIRNKQHNSIQSAGKHAYQLIDRVFHSPLCRAGALAGTTLTLGALGFRNSNLIMPVAALAMGILTKCFISKQRPQLYYEYALTRNLLYHLRNADTFPWWNTLITGKLTVGAIPLENWDHHRKLKEELKITHIVSIVKDFEFAPRILTSPLQHDKQDKNWLHIDTVQDGDPVPLDQLHQAVEWMQEKINSGGHVYIHCKSGKARSVMTAVAFLHKYGSEHSPELRTALQKVEDQGLEKRIQAIFAFVKTIRPQISNNAKEKKMVEEYARQLA